MKLLLFSDIHGNLSALNAVIKDISNKFGDVKNASDGVILLGDNIDYGMRSNEVIDVLSKLNIPILCSIWGNHENAILTSDFSRFSSERGRECAKNTGSNLNDSTRLWLMGHANHSGLDVLNIDGKRILAVHGSIGDPLWGKIEPGQADFSEYSDFDVVISGHSHIPHVFTVLVSADNPEMRNKKAITFINPGSVGQPRNHDPRASYAIWDTKGSIQLRAVEYDIEFEQSLFDGSVDGFYRDRLKKGV